MVVVALAAAAAAATPTSAQLATGPLGPGGFGFGLIPQLPDLPRRAPGADRDVLGAALSGPERALSGARRVAAVRLVREHPHFVETDDLGRPVVRGEVLALNPAADALAYAQQAGFHIVRRETLGELGIESVVLSPPAGRSAPQALRRLRALDPGGTYEFNHLYQTSGVVSLGRGRRLAPREAEGQGESALGLVDGSVAAGHPALRSSRIVQHPFAPGGARVTDHATAVASLMVGEGASFRGAAPGAPLMVADVYGPTPAGGSAQAIAGGLNWLAQNRVRVIDVSIVGPDNRLLAAAVAALVRKGVVVVAAVGNDGPAAPPLYPAAYPGVVAVTGVDGRGRVLPEAGRGGHVGFAAPGSDMAAAVADGGYVTVRGTSFAAPLVAGLIARRLSDALVTQDLGAPGRDQVYGRGLVGADLRTPPGRVGARSLALRGP